MRHKIRQLINIKKITLPDGIKLIQHNKPKIIDASCSSSRICVRAAEICMEKGLLPLKLKGFQLAMTLQNPYISLVPKSGLSVRKYPKNSIGLQLVKKAERLLGIKSDLGRIVVETSPSSKLAEVPSSRDIKRALNTFMFVFKNGKIKNMEQANSFCRKAVRGSIDSLKRKVHFLTFSSVNEPFFEYLGHVRDRQFIPKN